MKSFFYILPALLLANCASIVSTSKYPVAISSNPAGAQVAVKKSDGTVVHQATTPTSVTLKSSRGYFQSEKYTLEFTKKGYRTQTVQLNGRLNGWYIGNVVFGGGIGFLIVDPLTGAMWRLDNSANTNLTAMATVRDARGKTVKVVDRSSVPAELANKLVALR